jgi:aminoglycoside 6'-N-acetyltransferase I
VKNNVIKPLTIKFLPEWSEMAMDVYQESTPEIFIQEYHEGRFPDDFLYFVNDEPVAMLSLAKRVDWVEGSTGGPVAYIEGIYVKENFRHKGIAQELINFAKQWTIDQGMKQIGSDCLLENVDSFKFHTAVGFKEASRTVNFILDI